MTTTDILSLISILILFPMWIQYVFVGWIAYARLRAGENGYTHAIMIWALASASYVAVDMVKAGLMAGPAFYNRGLVVAAASLLARTVLLAAVSYLLLVMRGK